MDSKFTDLVLHALKVSVVYKETVYTEQKFPMIFERQLSLFISTFMLQL